MEEVLKNLHKWKGTTFGTMTQTSKKAEDLNNRRRETRDNIMFHRRHIVEDVIDAITPDTKMKSKKAVIQHKPNKRLEMLAKWKEEKEKKKKLAKEQTKPVFKVCHVPMNVGLTNLETVNKEIKGKRIKASKFAPDDHKFVAPMNIKPIDIPKIIKPKINSVAAVQKMKVLQSNKDKKSNMKSTPAVQPARSLQRATRTTQIKSSTSNVSKESKNTHIVTDAKNKMIKTKTKTLNPDVEANSNQEEAVNNISKANHAWNKIHESQRSSKKKKVSIIDLTNSPSIDVAKPTLRKTPYQSRKMPKHDELCKNEPKSLFTVDISSGSDIASNDSNSVEHILNATFEITDNTEHSENPQKGNITRDTTEQLSTKKRNSNELDSFYIGENESFSRSHRTTPLKNTRNAKSPKTRSSRRHSSLEAHKYETLPIETHKAPSRCKDIDELQEMPNEVKTPQKTPRRSKRTAHKPLIQISEVPEVEQQESNKKHRKSTKGQRGVLRRQRAIELTNNHAELNESCSPDYPMNDNCGSDAASITESDALKTPNKTPENTRGDIPVYVSPFVTISRGKDSARKEFQERLSQGGSLPASSCIDRVTSANTSPKAGATYFARVLENEIVRIRSLCEEWESYKENECPCEDACDMINTAIGQSNLLITKKFKQFRCFIDKCDDQSEDRPVTCADLHGFWEVIYMQVEDLNKRFAFLENLRNNKWEEILEVKTKAAPKRRGRPPKKTVAATSSLKDAIKAARMKKNQIQSQTNLAVLPAANGNEVTFDGGFFVVRSPDKSSSARKTPRRSVRKSLLATVLTQEAARRTRSISPGIAMMKAVHNARLAEGTTPARSILKTDGTKSTSKLNKSVLFNDIIEVNGQADENNSNAINLMNFTPDPNTPPKRTSRRIRLSRNKLF